MRDEQPAKVTRYGLEYSNPVLHEQPNGLYVHYIDYFALEQAYADVTAKLAQTVKERDKFERFWKDQIDAIRAVGRVLSVAGIAEDDGYGCYTEEERIEMLVKERDALTALITALVGALERLLWLGDYTAREETYKLLASPEMAAHRKGQP